MGRNTRTLILHSEQPMFDTLVMECLRGWTPGLSSPSDDLVDVLNERTRLQPKYVGPEVRALLVRDHGTSQVRALTTAARSVASQSPATGSIPQVMAADPAVKSPAVILAEGRATKSKSKRQPPAVMTTETPDKS